MSVHGAPPSTENNPPYSRNYRRYVLVLLTLVYAINFIDRQILVILQESIKADMDLSDTQLGLLTGFAFAIFYVSVGIPIARWADVGNRKNIISLAVAIWSGMTVLSGMTQNYAQLLLARIGVGIGEAGGSPPAHSIISDYYPPEERGKAMSIYSTGVSLGILLGFLIGGWINHAYGWRMAFFVVGVPGILVALLVKYTVLEPKRGQCDGDVTGEVPTTTFKETLGVLLTLKSFRFLALGAGLTAFVSYGVGNFMPSFLIRNFGFGNLEVGVSLALISGVGGTLGTFLGGYFADKLGAKDKRWYLWVPAIPGLISVPLMILAILSEQVHYTLTLLFLSIFSGAFYLGPIFAITHTLLSPGMRAMGSAVLFFILNLIGLGLGPLFVGVVSDLLMPTYGVDSLRYSLAITSMVGLFSAVCFFICATKLPGDLLRNQNPVTDIDDLNLVAAES